MKAMIAFGVLALLLVVVLASRNIVADEDSDQDGLPDWWELEYFGDLSYGADDDPDLDDFTNLEEYEAGTDPTDETSKPRPPRIDTN
ncbi:MAG: hypothetical protein KAU99_00890 [Thermoplasmata archaeon]|nr:hypothetical protein [Thermoplasmata archaeon]